MIFKDYLAEEWVRALGCTEPASIAYAASSASAECSGQFKSVTLTVDPKIYKNCYAVGIPHSGHKTGIKWAVAIGVNLPDPNLKLEAFRSIDPQILDNAASLIDNDLINISVDTAKQELYIECNIIKTGGSGLATISGDHTNLTCIKKNSQIVFKAPSLKKSTKSQIRKYVAELPLSELIELATSITKDDREKLSEGIELNKTIAAHGLGLFPKRFVELAAQEKLTNISKLVCAGVYARMWGEDFPVMSLAGSGNKGIVVSLPLAIWGNENGYPKEKIEEALALACLITSATTHRLGTLSAVCGCSNAAGLGLASGLVLLESGGEKEIGLAINNMVGNLSGMICDGAKIGCALKTMTSVDAAFRASALALSGLGIPPTDGIVGKSVQESMINLGRIATDGMKATDKEILSIMQEKI